jgi:hypothetical protein
VPQERREGGWSGSGSSGARFFATKRSTRLIALLGGGSHDPRDLRLLKWNVRDLGVMSTYSACATGSWRLHVDDLAEVVGEGVPRGHVFLR